MRIAVDAMGGDFAPGAVVAGVLDAVADLPDLRKVILVGDRDAINAQLEGKDLFDKIEVFHASESIAMDDAPVKAVRQKKDSSINRAVDLVKKGEADAMLSAGNTGAMVAASTIKLRTLAGIERPAIAAVMPTPRKPFVLIDAGANTECSPDLLVQFAVMGSVYSRLILHCEEPVVGLMSVGTEANKGNETTKDVFKRLKESPLNFKGNIEGHDLFKGEIDVAVCDGFVGNVILKTTESVAHAISTWIKREFTRNPVRVLGTLFLSGAMRALKVRMDPDMYGGAPLLGVNGLCIICHGAASPRAIYHAIRVGCESVTLNLNNAINTEIEKLGEIK